MTRESVSSLAAIGLGGLILLLPFALQQPLESGAIRTVAFGPVFVVAGSIVLAGVFSLLRQFLSRRQVTGIVLLSAGGLGLAVSFNLFLPQMTVNDYIPVGVLLSAFLIALGTLCFVGASRNDRAAGSTRAAGE